MPIVSALVFTVAMTVLTKELRKRPVGLPWPRKFMEASEQAGERVHHSGGVALVGDQRPPQILAPLAGRADDESAGHDEHALAAVCGAVV